MTEKTQARVRRGLDLWRERRIEFRRDRGLWFIPGSEEGVEYCVDLDGPRCTCPDNDRAGHVCKHIYAATVAEAVRGSVLRGELTES